MSVYLLKAGGNEEATRILRRCFASVFEGTTGSLHVRHRQLPGYGLFVGSLAPIAFGQAKQTVPRMVAVPEPLAGNGAFPSTSRENYGAAAKLSLPHWQPAQSPRC